MTVGLDRRIAEEIDYRSELMEAARSPSRSRRKFSQLLVSGKASKELLRGWAVNWFYFEKNVPKKDAAIISNCDIVSVRRLWVTKILEHDGFGHNRGAIEGWLKFAIGLGLTNHAVTEARYLDGVTSAVADYLSFVRSKSWVEGIATSIGMLFVPEFVVQRLVAFRRYYPWVEPNALDYFRELYSKARKDGRAAMQLVIRYADTPTLKADSIKAASVGSEIQDRIMQSIMERFG
jgi:pyrroloquinoline-quinone synthase